MKKLSTVERLVFVEAWYKVHCLCGDNYMSLEEFHRDVADFSEQQQFKLFSQDCAYFLSTVAKNHLRITMESMAHSIGASLSNVYVRMLHPDGSEDRFKHEQPRKVRKWLSGDKRTSNAIETKMGTLVDLSRFPQASEVLRENKSEAGVSTGGSHGT